jgi:hypothetical protein
MKSARPVALSGLVLKTVLAALYHTVDRFSELPLRKIRSDIPFIFLNLTGEMPA